MSTDTNGPYSLRGYWPFTIEHGERAGQIAYYYVWCGEYPTYPEALKEAQERDLFMYHKIEVLDVHETILFTRAGEWHDLNPVTETLRDLRMMVRYTIEKLQRLTENK